MMEYPRLYRADGAKHSQVARLCSGTGQWKYQTHQVEIEGYDW